jgi:thioredoxin reductase (NADPH)
VIISSKVPSETPDLFGAFPKLTDEQIKALGVQGTRSTVRGEVLFHQGDHTCDFFVILSGSVALVDGSGRDERIIGVHGPGRFLGELGLLTGEAVFTNAVVQEPGEVLVVPARRLRQIATEDPRLVTEDSVLGGSILRAYLIRRLNLIALGGWTQACGIPVLARSSRASRVRGT